MGCRSSSEAGASGFPVESISPGRPAVSVMVDQRGNQTVVGGDRFMVGNGGEDGGPGRAALTRIGQE